MLEGAPVNTFDLDIVHSRQPENVARLLDALESLDAVYRSYGEQRLRPQISHLSSPGRQLLITRFGPLDVLGSIGRSRSYDDLLPHTVDIDAGVGLRLRVLNLETLIAVREEVGGAKDAATCPFWPILRRTLEEAARR